jgi:hypothetical protein
MNKIEIMPAQYGFDKDTGRIYLWAYMPIGGKDYYLYASCDELDFHRNVIIDFSLEFYTDADAGNPINVKYNKELFDEIEASCYDMFYGIIDEDILDRSANV